MKKVKNINELLGPWKDPMVLSKFVASGGDESHKFLDRNRTIRSNWDRVHTFAKDILLSDSKKKVLDVGCGNGATLEIFRHYGHDAIGLDAPVGGSHLYAPMIESQGLKCIVHDGSILPYPVRDKEFDLVICWGVFNFFRPVSIWPNVLDEFARISKSSIILAPNMGKSYDEGKSLIEEWGGHGEFLKTKTSHSHKYRWDTKRSGS